jgi:hypothetical protein
MPEGMRKVMLNVAETYKQHLVHMPTAREFREDHKEAIQQSPIFPLLQQLARDKGVPLHLGHINVQGEDRSTDFMTALQIPADKPYGQGAVAQVVQACATCGAAGDSSGA